MIKVLFVHGLKSGPFGRKANFLRNNDVIQLSVPHMKYPHNFWSSFGTTLKEVYDFKPEIIVASSYGTILTILMLQTGIWTGPTILLSQAMGRFNKDLIWLPQIQSPILCIHGSKDTICNVQDSYDLIRTSNPSTSKILVVDDNHSLNSLCSADEPNLISHVKDIVSSHDYNTGPHINQDPWIMWRLTPVIVQSYPFWISHRFKE